MNVTIANKLVSLRKQYRFSQEELAEKIGVSRQAVSKWERAESSPDTDNLIALAKIYNLSIDEMLNYDINNVPVELSNINKNDNNNARKNNFEALKRFPIAILATIIYLLLGFIWDLWHPGWLIFLFIPIWFSMISHKKK